MLIKSTAVITFLVIICIPLFLHLNWLPIRNWDEARVAANSFEMNRNGNYLIPSFEGEPDMWNTKPPLLIWLQVIFIKILGFNELALRLPSAFAGLLTCLVILYFSNRLFKNYVFGAFACVVLVTTNGYIDIHAERTGDYDCLLALFTTAYSLCVFLYCEEGDKKWLKLFFIFLTLAVLTKSIQALLFLPGLAIYYLLRGRNRPIFNLTFFVGTFATLLIIIGYYLLREAYNPGYMQAVWYNELGGRYFEVIEENTAGPDYYAKLMPFYYFPFWIWLLPAGIITGFLSKNRQINNFTWFGIALTTIYIIIISISKTKLYWYTVPVFPFFSMMVAIFIYQLYLFLRSRIPDYTYAPLFILALVFLYPFQKTGRKVYKPVDVSTDTTYTISYPLKDALHGKLSLDNHVISFKEYNTHLTVYAKALEEKGQRIVFKDPTRLAAGDTVIACEPAVIKTIESDYNYQLLKKKNMMNIYLIR